MESRGKLSNQHAALAAFLRHDVGRCRASGPDGGRATQLRTLVSAGLRSGGAPLRARSHSGRKAGNATAAASPRVYRLLRQRRSQAETPLQSSPARTAAAADFAAVLSAALAASVSIRLLAALAALASEPTQDSSGNTSV